MFKWIVGLALFGAFAYWLVSGRKKNPLVEPEVKELDQRRFYVTPPDKDDVPPDDHEGTRL